MIEFNVEKDKHSCSLTCRLINSDIVCLPKFISTLYGSLKLEHYKSTVEHSLNKIKFKLNPAILKGTGNARFCQTLHTLQEFTLNNESFYIFPKFLYCWAKEVDIRHEFNTNLNSILSGDFLIKSLMSGTGQVWFRTPGEIVKESIQDSFLHLHNSAPVMYTKGIEFRIKKCLTPSIRHAKEFDKKICIFKGTGDIYHAPRINWPLLMISKPEIIQKIS